MAKKRRAISRKRVSRNKPKTPKLTKAEQIANMPHEEVAKASKSTLQGYVKTLRMGYTRRVQAFQRNEIISFADIQFKRNYVPPPANTPINKLSYNQLIMEIAQYRSFFTGKTSTIKGALEVNKEQDIRIFGKDSRGRPNRTMSNEERIKYWSVYNEYLEQNKGAVGQYGSDRIQIILGDLLFNKSRISATYDAFAFLDLLNQVENTLRRDKFERDWKEAQNHEIFRGRGPFRKR